MLHKTFTFIDVETTGLSPFQDRIIEVGIVRVSNGRVTKTFESLVNPGVKVPSFIESMTGISQKALSKAPVFSEISQKISALLRNSIFVAHNVEFDYQFLKNEYKRLGYSFQSKHFCTVQLSKKVFPQFYRHNLDSIIQRFNIVCQDRHRALSDASVLWEFFQLVTKQIGKSQLEETYSSLIRI